MENNKIYSCDNTTPNNSCPNPENKLISFKNGEMIIQPMSKIELLGKYYGINVLEYQDYTNYELYDEMLFSCNTEEEIEECHSTYYAPDTYDEYFERLAAIAVEIGSERAELKCLIKSLILKYRSVNYIEEFPHELFSTLYNRLISSNDLEKLRVAERLGRYHAKKLDTFLFLNVSDNIRLLKCREHRLRNKQNEENL